MTQDIQGRVRESTDGLKGRGGSAERQKQEQAAVREALRLKRLEATTKPLKRER